MRKSWPKFPVGESDFGSLRRGGFVFVDNSGFIADFIDSEYTTLLLTSFRRSGKSLLQSMCSHFFQASVLDMPTAALFEGLNIATKENGDYLRVHQGKYPVIHVSFKNIKEGTFQEALAGIEECMASLYSDHMYLLESEKIDDNSKSDFLKIRNREGSPQQVANALQLLTKLMYRHHGQKVIVLIDEYDQPMNHAISKGYFDQLKNFMGKLFGACLKDNPYLLKCLMTGILRIAKAGIFSDLNNVKEFSLLDEPFSRHLGFTQEQLAWLVSLLPEDKKVSLDEIKHWYNGYIIGGRVVYNPWSIMNCFAASGKTGSYWINVSDNQLIKDRLKSSQPVVHQVFEQLLQGEIVEVPINYLVDLVDEEDPATLWTLLLHSGYLTVVPSLRLVDSDSTSCFVRIPNHEVRLFYLRTFHRWLQRLTTYDSASELIQCLLLGNIERFQAILEEFLLNSFSFFDVGGRNSEQAYHAFVLGLIAGLHHHYVIKSNRESGFGRFDVIMIPNDKEQIGILFEFKSIDRKCTEEKLQLSTQQAMAQIKKKHYVSEFELHGIKNRRYLAITFAGKRVYVLSQSEISDEGYRQKPLQLSWAPSPGDSPSSSESSPVKDLQHFPQYISRTFGACIGVARQVTGFFEGDEITFDIYRTGGRGHCGFYSLPIPYDRLGVVELLLKNANNNEIRSLVADEIMELAMSRSLPRALIEGHEVINRFVTFLADNDQIQQLTLTEILDQLDPNRNQFPEYDFNSIYHYLSELPMRNEREQNCYERMISFQQNFESIVTGMRDEFCEQSLFEAFVRTYLGGQGHLSFSMGGVHFDRQTSSLDAILLAMEPSIRLCIWQDDPHQAGKVHLVYQGGPLHGTVTHVHHQGGLDSHFELMAESVARALRLSPDRAPRGALSPELKRRKTVRDPSLWGRTSLSEEGDEEQATLPMDEDDESPFLGSSERSP